MTRLSISSLRAGLGAILTTTSTFARVQAWFSALARMLAIGLRSLIWLDFSGVSRKTLASTFGASFWRTGDYWAVGR